MASGEYLVYVDDWSGTFGGSQNIALLPGIEYGSPGGSLSYYGTGTALQKPVSIVGELTVAGTFSDPDKYNIDQIYIASRIAGSTAVDESVATISFSNGGVLNLSAQTADMQKSNAAQSQFLDSDLKFNTYVSYTILQAVTNAASGNGLYDATTFLSKTGLFKIVSDLVGTIKTHGNLSVTGYLSVADGKTHVDNASNNTINVTSLRAQDSMEIYNNFIGSIFTDSDFVARGYAAASANGNIATSQALWAVTGSITIDGDFGQIKSDSSLAGSISSIMQNVTITASTAFLKSDPVYCKRISKSAWDAMSLDEQGQYRDYVDPTGEYGYIQKNEFGIDEAAYRKLTGEQRKPYEFQPAEEATGSASATGNEIGVYGLRAEAGSIIMKKDHLAEISTRLADTTIVVKSNGANTTANLEVTFNNFGMRAQNYSLSGMFDGTITSVTDDISLSARGVALDTTLVTYTQAAIYMSDSLTIDGHFSGVLDVFFSDFKKTGDNTPAPKSIYNVYGVYAANAMTVGLGKGIMDTEITVDLSNNIKFLDSSSANIYGIKTKLLTAGSLEAEIVVRGTSDSLAVGVDVDTFKNNVDSVYTIQGSEPPSTFDIIGDITVSGSSSNIGILVGVPGNIKLRVSSDISSSGYAFWEGSATKSSLTYSGAGDDRLEIAAGSTIRGDIGLGAGTDNIVVDSNARVYGNLDDNGGRFNLTISLNQFGSVNGDLNVSTALNPIFHGTFPVEKTTLLVDVNDARNGETYYLLSNAAITQGTKDITIVYNGQSILMNLASKSEVKFYEYEKSDVDKKNPILVATVNGSVVNNVVCITVTDTGIPAENKVANVLKYEVTGEKDEATNEIYLYNTIEYELSGGALDSLLYKLVITYDIYGKEGQFIRKGVGTVAPVDQKSNSIVIGDLGAGETMKNIHMEIQREDKTRLNALAVTGTMDAEQEIFRLDWAFSGDQAITNAYYYELEYSIRRKGESDFSNSTVVTMKYLSTSYELNGIADGDEVRARIRLKRAGTTQYYLSGEWSETIDEVNTVVYNYTPPPDGLMASRISTQANALRRLEWNDMRDVCPSGISRYEIEYFDSGETLLTASEIAKVWAREDKDYTILQRTTSANYFLLANLDMNKNVYWRVRAVTNADGAGKWSSSLFKVVDIDETAPVKMADENVKLTFTMDYGTPAANGELGNQSLTISWVDNFAVDDNLNNPAVYVSGLAGYVMYYKTESETTYNRYFVEVSPDALPTYSITFENIDLNHLYDFYFTAIDKAGNESGKLNLNNYPGGISKLGDRLAPVEMKLNHILEPGEGEFITNSSGATSQVINFTITQGRDVAEDAKEISGLYKFVLQMKKYDSAGNEVWVTVGNPFYSKNNKGDIEIPTITIDTRDILGGRTEWRIGATDKAGNTGYTGSITILSDVTAPRFTSPASNLRGYCFTGDSLNGLAVFSWDPAVDDLNGSMAGQSGVSHYVVSLYQVDGQKYTQLMNDTTVTVDDELWLEYSGVISTRHSYMWRITAYDKVGNYKTYTVNVEAQAPGNISFDSTFLHTPNVVADDETFSVSLSWNPAESTGYTIDYYKVYYKDTAAGANGKWIYVGTTNGTSISLDASSGLLMDHTYSWAVQAVDSHGYPTGKVQGEDFTIKPKPGPPMFAFDTISTSIPDYTGDKFNFTISWTVKKGSAAGYRLEYALADSNEFSTLISAIDGSATSITVSVDMNHVYKYKLVATDGSDSTIEVTSPLMQPKTDITKPLFSGSTITITAGGGYQYQLSLATDPTGGKGEPVSGLKGYRLYFSTTPDVNLSKSYIFVSANSGKLDKSELSAIGISSGDYYYWAVAQDKAGNLSTPISGTESIFVDFRAPEGYFIRLPAPEISVTYTTIDNGINVPYREPSTISFTFDASNNDYQDPSGVFYVYEISTDSLFNSNILYSSTWDLDHDGRGYEDEKLTLSTENGGIFVLAGLKSNQKVYWRVKAVDALGNATDWTKGNYFTVSDPDLERPIDDTIKPTTPEKFAISVYAGRDSSGNAMFIYNNPDNPIDENNGMYVVANSSGEWVIKSTGVVIDEKYVLDLTKNNAIKFSWNESRDPFAIIAYEISVSNGIPGENRTLTVDARLIKTGYYVGSSIFYGFAAGTYTFSVRSVDGSGKASNWSNTETITLSAPDRPTEDGRWSGSAFTLKAADPKVGYDIVPKDLPLGAQQSYSVVWAKMDGIEKDGDLNLKFSDLKSKVNVTVYDSTGKKVLKKITLNPGYGETGDILFDRAKYGSLVYIKVESALKDAYDASFTIAGGIEEYFPGQTAPSSFEEAKYSENRKYLTTDASGESGSITITNEWVGYKSKADYFMFVGAPDSDTKARAGMISSVSLSNVTSKMKVTLYNIVNGKNTKIKTITVSGDTELLFAGQLVYDSYYIVVESYDGGKGKENTNYNMTVDEKYLPKPTNSSNQSNILSLTDGRGSADGEWVGFGDPIDYYNFTTENAGALKINLDGVTSNVKVSLYQSNGKKLKSVTIKGSSANVFKDYLLVAGSYYVTVESADAGKGKYNTFYDLSVDSNYFHAASSNSSFYTADRDTLQVNAKTTVANDLWVGYGDATDYYAVTFQDTGIFNLGVYDIEAGVKVKVSVYENNGGVKGKQIGSKVISSETDNAFGKDIILRGGNYFVVVESGDKGKGKQNTGYNLNFMVNEANTVTPIGNDIVSETLNPTDTVDWFSYNAAGNQKLSVNLDVEPVYSKSLKYEVYGADGKKVSWDSKLNQSKTELTGGMYFVKVMLTDKNAYASYNIGIAGIS